MPTLYRYIRCGDMRSPGVVDRRNGPLGLRDNDNDDDLPYIYYTVSKRRQSVDPHIIHRLLTKVLDLVNEV